jgi:hypothetical protein
MTAAPKPGMCNDIPVIDLRPIVSIGLTYVLVGIYGYDEGRVQPTRPRGRIGSLP